MKLACLSVVLLIALGACVSSKNFSERVEQTYPPLGEFVSYKDVALHVIDRGDGSPVMMIHGASANAREYLLTLEPELSGEMVRLLIPDRPGHGYSGRPDEGFELGIQAEAMATILKAKAEEPVVIVGHSFGGAVALRLALDHPELVKSVVLLAPVTHDWGDGGVAWYNRIAAFPLVGNVFSQFAPSVGPDMARASLDRLFSPAPAPENYADRMGVDLLFRPPTFRRNAADVVNLKQQLAEQQKRYGEISVPVIVFSGAGDTVLKPKLHSAKLRRDAPEHVILVKLADEGHMPQHGKAGLISQTILRLAKGESVQEADFETPNG